MFVKVTEMMSRVDGDQVEIERRIQVEQIAEYCAIVEELIDGPDGAEAYIVIANGSGMCVKQTVDEIDTLIENAEAAAMCERCEMIADALVDGFGRAGVRTVSE